MLSQTKIVTHAIKCYQKDNRHKIDTCQYENQKWKKNKKEGGQKRGWIKESRGFNIFL